MKQGGSHTQSNFLLQKPVNTGMLEGGGEGVGGRGKGDLVMEFTSIPSRATGGE